MPSRDSTAPAVPELSVPCRRSDAPEGELRTVSLSAFLSDVAGSGDGSAIRFDDPMNSLDQEYQIGVAKRLAKEARTRQMIVFTHSTPFAGRWKISEPTRSGMRR